MEEEEEKLSESFKKELETITKETILSPEYRKKKLMLWVVRNTISVILYVIFWKHTWVRWTLLLTVPLSIFSLVTIVAGNYFLQRKIERTKKKLEEADRLMGESDGNKNGGENTAT